MIEIVRKNARIEKHNFHAELKAFYERNPTNWLPIRPDRPFDPEAHRYPNDEARSKGDAAMKAWFEYLAVKEFFAAFLTWLWILKSGRSILVVCADPIMLDLNFIPPQRSILPPDFWREFEDSRLPIDHRYDDPEARQRIIQGFKNLTRELNSGEGQPLVKGWSTLGDTQPLREWGSTPLSSELRDKLGVGVAQNGAAE